MRKNAYAILEPMKGGETDSRGFTIVETMIVLAVSGLIFLIAAFFIAGKQRETQFNQGIRDAQAQLQQIINEVATGFYPDSNNFSCTPGATGPTFSTVIQTGQGSNSGCIFLGKAIQFQTGTNDPEQLSVLTIAGNQNDSSGDTVTDLSTAFPKVVPTSIGGALTTDLLENGITTKWIHFNGGASAGAIAFVAALNPSVANNGLTTGTLQVSAVPVNGTSLGMSTAAMTAAINANLTTSTQNPSAGVQVCLVSGTTQESGLITIGGSGRSLGVNLSIRENQTCS